MKVLSMCLYVEREGAVHAFAFIPARCILEFSVYLLNYTPIKIVLATCIFYVR